MTVVNRYAPVSLQDLASRTHYSPQEIQLIYRAFKNDCPTAIIYEDKFKELYSYYFPLGGTLVHEAIQYFRVGKCSNSPDSQVPQNVLRRAGSNMRLHQRT